MPLPLHCLRIMQALQSPERRALRELRPQDSLSQGRRIVFSSDVRQIARSGVAGAAFLVEVQFAGSRVTWSQIFPLGNFCVVAPRAGIMNPPHQGANLLVAQVGKLRHRRKLRGLGYARAEEGSDEIPILVAPHQSRMHQVSSFAPGYQVQTVAVGASKQDEGLFAML